jgi:hypothetical protein
VRGLGFNPCVGEGEKKEAIILSGYHKELVNQDKTYEKLFTDFWTAGNARLIIPS